MPRQQHVVVLGAGVTGLTTANFLAEAGYLVTVVAAHIPGETSIDYTSPWAGAHWRTAATPSEPMVCDWDVQTYKYWRDILDEEARSPNLPRSSLKMQDSFLYWDDQPTEEFWWSPHVLGFRQLSPLQEPILSANQRTPSNVPQVAWAVSFQAPSLNSPQYLQYLRQRGRALGVQLVQAKLPSGRGELGRALAAADTEVASHTARPRADVFINATGLAAGALCDDPAVYPVRGQTVLVRGEAASTRTRHGAGYGAYCIPRPGSGMTILGGTRERGCWSATPDPATTQDILERNRILAPELLTGPDGGFDVVSVQCGLRPGRDGGPRVEKEVVVGRKVVHAYGHSGAGYQNSVGSARVVVKLRGCDVYNPIAKVFDQHHAALHLILTKDFCRGIVVVF